MKLSEGRLGNMKSPARQDDSDCIVAGIGAPRDKLCALQSELAELEAERAALRRVLRLYERDFLRREGRRVSGLADARPFARHYRRYKEIKGEIAHKNGRISSECLDMITPLIEADAQ